MKLSGAGSIFFEWEGVHDVLQCFADSFRIRRLWVGWRATVGRMCVQAFLVSELEIIRNLISIQEVIKSNSPCRPLRWFCREHHCSVHSEMRERQTCLVPCEQWRRSFSHSFQCPGNSSSEHEPQQLFGHRPGLGFSGDGKINIIHSVTWPTLVSFNSPHSVVRRSSMARWIHLLTSNNPELLRHLSSRLRHW